MLDSDFSRTKILYLKLKWIMWFDVKIISFTLNAGEAIRLNIQI